MTRALRVLHAIDSLRGGGAQTLLAELAGELDRRGDVDQHVLVVSARGLDEDLRERVDACCGSVTVLGADSLRERALFRAVADSLRRVGPDVVHSHLATANVATRMTCTPRRIPHVSTVHTPPGPSAEDGRSRDLAEGLTAGLSTLIVAPAQHIADGYCRRWLVPRSRMRLIRNPAPHRPLAAGYSRESTRSALASSADTTLVLSIARLMPAKGVEDLIQAARELRGTATRFVVAGGGPEQPRLESLIQHLGLQDSVVLLGERQDIGDLIAAADIFCLPSHHEGAPISLLEAMSGGLATVATDVGGVPELVTDGMNGLLVRSGSPAGLADAVRRLASDPALRGRLGSAAQLSTAGLTPRAMTAAYEALYRRVSSSGRRFSRSPRPSSSHRVKVPA
ncbi:MAG: hypothetical protein QOG62_1319 [Thermoleophilaceae bacterium]|jgi:glycosyltransferase involved in cell wall biosynthesis|nr:hypothetical protein [Thermoleophilaceae bacterium]